MVYGCGPDHIHVDMDQALDEVMICECGSSEIAALPKCTLARFAAVVLLGKSSGKGVRALFSAERVGQFQHGT
jgi:hypothetical protein